MNTRLNLSLFQQNCLLIMALIICHSCGQMQARREIRLSTAIPEIDKTREHKILTAFFGLDNALTQQARAIYFNAPGKDGMPLVFSHEIDPETIEGADFEVTTKDGTAYIVEAASLLPANEEFELRTILLIGEYGNYPDNPPETVKIVGDLVSRTGFNFNGQQIDVIPLEVGPILSDAEYFTFTEDYPYLAEGIGCDCPKEGTNLVIKAIWSGGVRAMNGDELGNNELEDFTVTLVQGSDTLKVTPYMLADLSDNDNNIDLCLKETGVPILLEVNASVAIDPRDDPNAMTSVAVRSRW